MHIFIQLSNRELQDGTTREHGKQGGFVKFDSEMEH